MFVRERWKKQEGREGKEREAKEEEEEEKGKVGKGNDLKIESTERNGHGTREPGKVVGLRVPLLVVRVTVVLGVYCMEAGRGRSWFGYV